MNIINGMPSYDFYGKAWESEPLTKALRETDIMFALPKADEGISLVAVNEDNHVVGQCSANKVADYWSHVEELDVKGQTVSTQNFNRIHRKAVAVEKEFLKDNHLSVEEAWHNAGVAVLPDRRGKKLGLTMVRKQMELGIKNSMSALFYEATNQFSAAIAEKLNFTKLAEFKYSDLAVELADDRLHEINDSFTVWCFKNKEGV